MKLLLNTIFFVILYGSCINDNSKPYIKKDKADIFIHLRSAINEGDGKAYNKAARYFSLERKDTEFYYYSFIMANKHNNPEAYFHLYRILKANRKVNGVDLYGADKNSEKMSLFFLLKSYELGYEQSEFLVKNIFGNDTIPSSKSILCD